MILSVTLAQMGSGLLFACLLTPRRHVGEDLPRLLAAGSALLLAPLALNCPAGATGAPALLWTAMGLALIGFVVLTAGLGGPCVATIAGAAGLSASGLAMAVLAFQRPVGSVAAQQWLLPFGVLTSALLLGSTFGAMILGHWYLVNFGMPITPLRSLAMLMGAASVAKAASSGAALAAHGWPAAAGCGALGLLLPPGIFYLVRVSIGIGGPLALAPLVWGATRLHATQSATGILYAAAVFVLIGELTGNFLLIHTVLPF